MPYLTVHGVKGSLQHNPADGGGAAGEQVQVGHHVTGYPRAQRVAPDDDLK